MSTIYIKLADPSSAARLQSLYRDFYHNEPFVQVLPANVFPELRHVQKTNQCHINITHREDGSVVILTAIDNLGKGAAGQAVQNMNLMLGFDERMGLS